MRNPTQLLSILALLGPLSQACGQEAAFQIRYELVPESWIIHIDGLGDGCFSGADKRTNFKIEGTFDLLFFQGSHGLSGRILNVSFTSAEGLDFSATGSGQYVDSGNMSDLVFELEIQMNQARRRVYLSGEFVGNADWFPFIDSGRLAQFGAQDCFLGAFKASPSPQDMVLFFMRGDVNGDRRVNVTDSVAAITHMFLGGQEPRCLDAVDTNDDSKLDLSDAVLLLQYLFLGGARPAIPSRLCGLDPTDDQLDCRGQAACLGEL